LCCIAIVLVLTPVLAKLSMQPESSDGFASVGTILPKEKVALLPGGLFASVGLCGSARDGRGMTKVFREKRVPVGAARIRR
jgi:hypothetical protein